MAMTDRALASDGCKRAVGTCLGTCLQTCNLSSSIVSAAYCPLRWALPGREAIMGGMEERDEVSRGAHSPLVTADAIVSVFGIAAAVSLLKSSPFSGFTATAQAISAVLMLLAPVFLLFAGILLAMGCGRLCAMCSGACLGSMLCFAIAFSMTYGGLGPWHTLVACVVVALSALTVRAAFQVGPKPTADD